MAITTKGTRWELFNSLWMIFYLSLFLTWISVLYPGIRLRNKKWILFGVLYAIPTFLLFIVVNNTAVEKNGAIYTLVMTLFFLAIPATIIHSIMLRKPFLVGLAQQFGGNEVKFKQSLSKKNDYHQNLITQFNNLRSEINDQIHKSDQYDSGIVQDLLVMLETYSEQFTELVERDKKISDAGTQMSLTEIDKKIADLQGKLTVTENPSLANEYNQMIVKYEGYKKSHNDLIEHKEMSRLRLDSTLMSLQQIKVDLLKLEGIADQEQKESFFATFEEKTNDLSQYLNILRNSYDNL